VLKSSSSSSSYDDSWTYNGGLLTPSDIYLRAAYHFTYGALEVDSSTTGINTLAVNGSSEITGKYGNAILGPAGSLTAAAELPMVAAPASGRIFITTKMTAACWIRGGSAYDNMVISQLSTVSGAPVYDWQAIVTATSSGHSSAVFSVRQSDGTLKSGTYHNLDSAAGAWHHFALVADGTYLRLYWDGVLQASEVAYDGTIRNSANTAGWTDGDIRISTRQTGTGSSDQAVDEMYIWNEHALSAAQVAALYNSGTGSFWVPS
jgi:hypothetical protein